MVSNPIPAVITFLPHKLQGNAVGVADVLFKLGAQRRFGEVCGGVEYQGYAGEEEVAAGEEQ